LASIFSEFLSKEFRIIVTVLSTPDVLSFCTRHHY